MSITSASITANPNLLSASNLGPDHRAALELTISNILSTDLAFETFAQVVDGIPICDAYFEYYSPKHRPEYLQNLKPSEEACQIFKAFHAQFHADMLQFAGNIAQAYQNADPGSKTFNLRLMELIAIACHNIATRLYIEADGGLRKPTGPPTLPPNRHPLLRPPPPKVAELYHADYEDWEQYPNGVADMVGYWAEYRLFGGVVIFDRGESGLECENAFIHPIDGHKIFQLSDHQIAHFTRFALSEHQPPPTRRSYDTRFRAEKYARRVDPYDAMALHIYRDRYERKIPEVRPHSCVRWLEDDPLLLDQYKLLIERHGG
ncbi:hypothetical protein PRK78_006402 [Emydomyces testavorans]|uniref:Uncharacterized protein n=1 Tax=Emydomyces testavorans TaxID=2070801 RepID=A0AAF0INK3_9EURO|nr:hypothetical protein PRK78_006402 [Emydomyces testavorans]